MEVLHGGNDNHDVRGDAGDAVEKVGGEPRQVALREITRRKNLHHVCRLIGAGVGDIDDPSCLFLL